MKVGTDGVLLGAWVDLKVEARSPLHLLDVGTGTGLIALMMAQRLHQMYHNSCSLSSDSIQSDFIQRAKIDAIEIDEEASIQADENVARSPWPDQVQVIHQSIQRYSLETPARYDLRYDRIVSNPPYFVNSLPAPDPVRSLARHASSLPLEELCPAASRLLKPTGSFSVILPADQFSRARDLALKEGLACSRCCWVKPMPHLSPKRVMTTFQSQVDDCSEEELTLEISRHHLTPEYRLLVEDFYLAS
ncbi:MAG: tRNA (adenosine(37)-N6)-methyltransferase TrmM [Chloroflexota bacterium]